MRVGSINSVELNLLDDPYMYLMVESGTQCEVSMITKKYAEANNPYVDGYDVTKPSNCLMYVEANNLYGWAMSQKLPEKQFDWMTKQQLERFDVMQIAEDADTGYILEIDLEYPEKLHNLHSDLSVAPEQQLRHPLCPLEAVHSAECSPVANSSWH